MYRLVIASAFNDDALVKYNVICCKSDSDPPISLSEVILTGSDCDTIILMPAVDVIIIFNSNRPSDVIILINL